MTEATFNVIDDPTVDREEFSRRFRLYEAECSDYRLREAICGDVRGLRGVAALRNDGDARTVQFLACPDASVEDAIREAVKTASGGKAVVRRVSADTPRDDVLIQLLLNSLRSLDTSRGDTVSNASGSCLVIWETTGKPEDPDQVVCLRFDVSPTDAIPGEDAVTLSCRVESYTNVRFKDGGTRRMVFNPRHPFETFVQYAVVDGRLVKVPADWRGPRFVRRGLREFGKDTRNRVDFVDFDSEDALSATRSYAISSMVSTFDMIYGDIVSLRLRSMSVGRRDIDRNRRFADEKGRIASILSDGVRIIDHVGDPGKVAVLTDACSDSGVAFEVTGTPRFGLPVIHIVPDKGSVPEVDDPYGRDAVSIVQHVQVGSIRKGRTRSTGESILKELAIKRDVAEDVMRMFDWTSLGFQSDVVFALPARPRKRGEEGERPPEDRVALLTVHPDGTMSFSTARGLEAPFWSTDITDGGAEGVIEWDGNVMEVRTTDVFAVTDPMRLRDAMRENVDEGRSPSYGLRNAEFRDECLVESTDINWIPFSDTDWLYYVGEIGYGMRTTVPTASVVRRVHVVKGTQFMDRLVCMLDVAFVRNRRSTVLPFPFKYLREYANRDGLDTDTVSQGRRLLGNSIKH